MADSGVYEIRNLASGKRYVGSALNLESRRSNHFSKLSAGGHANIHLQRAYDRDGPACFDFRVLFSSVPPAILTRLEQAAMDVLRPEYNIEKKAGSSLGLRRGPMREEHKEAIRKGLVGCVMSDEARGKMSLAAMGNTRAVGHRNSLGYKHTTEAKERIGIAARGNKYALGYRHTEDAKARIGAASRARSLETREKLSTATKRQWICWREAREK